MGKQGSERLSGSYKSHSSQEALKGEPQWELVYEGVKCVSK